MCLIVDLTINDDLLVLVRTELRDLIDKLSVFTAHDVTRVVRSENVGMDVPHPDVREAVRAILDEEYDDYSVTPTEMKNGQWPMVYHPDDVSPTTHPNAKAVAAVDPADSGGTTDSTDTYIRKLTGEKRVTVPIELLVKLGLTAGKEFSVVAGKEGITLSSTVDGGDTTMRVNSDGRVRLSFELITEGFPDGSAGILPNAKFYFEIVNDSCITVSL